MWKDFDAYIAPDGRVFNNVRFVGEQDGLYRFNKCLAEHGFYIGAVVGLGIRYRCQARAGRVDGAGADLRAMGSSGAVRRLCVRSDGAIRRPTVERFPAAGLV